MSSRLQRRSRGSSFGPPVIVEARTDAGKIPPHDLDAEALLIGHVGTEPEVYKTALLRVDPADFYSGPNATIWGTMRDLAREGAEPSLDVVLSRLRSLDKLESVGGKAYVGGMILGTPASPDLGFHVRRVKDLAALRRTIGKLQQAAGEGYAAPNLETIARAHGPGILSDMAQASSGAETVSASIDGTFTRVLNRAMGRERPVTTGLPALDEKLRGGFWPGLAILVGLAGKGKTQFALGGLLFAAIAELHNAHAEGRAPNPCAYVATELDKDELNARLLALLLAYRGVGDHEGNSYHWTDLLYPRQGDAALLALLGEAHESTTSETPLACALRELRALPIEWHCVKGKRFTYADLEWFKVSRPPLLVIDYLQHIAAPEGHATEPREVMTRAAEACFALGRADNGKPGIPILAISSTSRANYSGLGGGKTSDESDVMGGKDEDAARYLAAAKESGDIEYAASVVMALGRNQDDDPSAFWLAVAKNRRGLPGFIPLSFVAGNVFAVRDASGSTPRIDERKPLQGSRPKQGNGRKQ